MVFTMSSCPQLKLWPQKAEAMPKQGRCDCACLPLLTAGEKTPTMDGSPRRLGAPCRRSSLAEALTNGRTRPANRFDATLLTRHQSRLRKIFEHSASELRT